MVIYKKNDNDNVINFKQLPIDYLLKKPDFRINHFSLSVFFFFATKEIFLSFAIIIITFIIFIDFIAILLLLGL